MKKQSDIHISHSSGKVFKKTSISLGFLGQRLFEEGSVAGGDEIRSGLL
jgi:hypothetical protein